MNRSIALLLAAILVTFLAWSQRPEPPITRADSLRGMLSPERTCYDLTFYHLNIRVNPSDSSVRGTNDITFRVVTPLRRMQLDLFRNMVIDRITIDGNESPLVFTRDEDAFFVEMPGVLNPGERHTLRVRYGGKPKVARRPPWDGGFSWDRDSSGNPWVVVTCEGTGASLWWPNKDHWADEPDSMLISVAVPPGLQNVSNGRLRRQVVLPDGWTRFDWFVGSPINNYNVTVNVARYAHFADTHIGQDTLTLDYYVMPENLEKAKRHFRQVREMLTCFEKHFGPYPFYRDGYKLVESRHLGMEHQSAVAYGNWYLGGYRGRSWSEAGLNWDFIIIHESAHEWWGNSVTAKDPADMWIHESFGAYAEAIFIEDRHGYAEALKYINGKKPNVGNRSPIMGVYNVNREGSGDMYDKGQLMLNTLRSVMDNDSLWFGLLRDMAVHFRHQTVSAPDIFGFVNRYTGKDFGYFFDQYLRHTAIPVLEVGITKKGPSVTARYRWKAEVGEFRMPVRVTTGKGRWGWITPTTAWQSMDLGSLAPGDFAVEQDRFYVGVQVRVNYVDPATPSVEWRPGML